MKPNSRILLLWVMSGAKRYFRSSSEDYMKQQKQCYFASPIATIAATDFIKQILRDIELKNYLLEHKSRY